MKGRTRYDHGRVAPVYESIACSLSAGAIPRAKARQLESMRPGARVLYAGVGAGEDALRAARLGMAVTAVDVSSAMLGRFERRLAREALPGELIVGSILDHRVREPYDFVIANFFLNLFDDEALDQVLAQLRLLVRAGGELRVADFAPPSGSPLARFVQGLYYWPIHLVAHALGLCARHPLYDVPARLDAVGLELVERKPVECWKGGPAIFENWAARPCEPSAGKL